MKISESPTSFGGPVVAALDLRPFPLRTLMVCLTVWLIATEVLIFDQIRFNAKAELVEQAARALRGSQLIVPSERTPQLSDRAKMEKL
jgi:hypothetical protein